MDEDVINKCPKKKKKKASHVAFCEKEVGAENDLTPRPGGGMSGAFWKERIWHQRLSPPPALCPLPSQV